MKKTVYSDALKFEDSAIRPASDKIPLVKIDGDQKLKLELHAKLGIGKQHAKWQPVSMCSYKYFPKIMISKKCSVCGKCVEMCPRKVLIKADNKLEVRDLMACTLCQDCAEACPEKPSAIEVSGEEDAFIFSLESTRALPPERIITEAVKILDKQLKELEGEIKVKKSEED
jgi:DNA-directed RNA polymerase subunit D